NLTPEHLDFHGTIESYFEDKAALFAQAREAIINIDDEWGRRLLPRCSSVQTYSITGAPADWSASGVEETPTHIRFDLHSPIGQTRVRLPVVGVVNVSNAIAAMAAASHTGASLETLRDGVESFPGVPGRMQLVTIPGATDHPRTIIDFAHTPAALENL